jgi:hypothetical protein
MKTKTLLTQFLLLASSVCIAHQVSAEIEPNNLSTAANHLSVSETLFATIESGQQDIDWYTLEASADTSLEIDVTSLAASRTRSGDLNVMVIRESDAYVLGQYKIGPSNNSLAILMTIEQTDDYLISLSNSEYLSSKLDYQITVNASRSEVNAYPLAGLWKVGNQGYASIHQQGSEIAVVVMGFSDAAGFRWETLAGTLEGDKAQLKTTIGYVSMEIDATFDSTTSAEFTVLSCATIIEGNPCRFTSGITFYLEKMESWR